MPSQENARVLRLRANLPITSRAEITLPSESPKNLQLQLPPSPTTSLATQTQLSHLAFRRSSYHQSHHPTLLFFDSAVAKAYCALPQHHLTLHATDHRHQVPKKTKSHAQTDTKNVDLGRPDNQPPTALSHNRPRRPCATLFLLLAWLVNAAWWRELGVVISCPRGRCRACATDVSPGFSS